MNTEVENLTIFLASAAYLLTVTKYVMSSVSLGGEEEEEEEGNSSNKVTACMQYAAQHTMFYINPELFD